MKKFCMKIFNMSVWRSLTFQLFYATVFLSIGLNTSLGQMVPQQSGSPSVANSQSYDKDPVVPGFEQSKQSAKGSELVPLFDPASENVQWRGYTWNLNNNRLFQARFEKYINALEHDSEEEKAYQKMMAAMLRHLMPSKATPKSVAKAFNMLDDAATYEADNNLCDIIANASHAVSLTLKKRKRLYSDNAKLEDQRRIKELNLINLAAKKRIRKSTPRNASLAKEEAKKRQLERDFLLQPEITRLAEISGSLLANKAEAVTSIIQAKTEYQAFMVQLYLQRRFQHVLLASAFYRQLFRDGDNSIKLDGEVKNIFKGVSDMSPTVSTLESLAHESIKDANEGVEAFTYLMEQSEMEGASKRLAEAFFVGEHLPALRNLPRKDKRRILKFTRSYNQLLSALDVKDYALAEQLIDELRKLARDFDYSKALAVVETAKVASNMLLGKAKMAAEKGQTEKMEEHLQKAVELWPRNPKLKEVTSKIFENSGAVSSSIKELSKLLERKNYREIYDNKGQYIAATALDETLRDELQDVLEKMQGVEIAITQARELQTQGNYEGAWEIVSRASHSIEHDRKLSELELELTHQAAGFVRAISQAKKYDEQGETGASLAWYLNAKKQYPLSTLAHAAIEDLASRLLDEDLEGNETEVSP